MSEQYCSVCWRKIETTGGQCHSCGSITYFEFNYGSSSPGTGNLSPWSWAVFVTPLVSVPIAEISGYDNPRVLSGILEGKLAVAKEALQAIEDLREQWEREGEMADYNAAGALALVDKALKAIRGDK